MNKTYLVFPLVLQITSVGEHQGSGGGRDIFLDKDVTRRTLCQIVDGDVDLPEYMPFKELT